MATDQVLVITVKAASAAHAVTIDRAVERALLAYFNKRADQHAQMIPLDAAQAEPRPLTGPVIGHAAIGLGLGLVFGLLLALVVGGFPGRPSRRPALGTL